jgi:CRISPR-associated exonuclease Cas4
MLAHISITPSLVIEYLYCPRFIYFMKVLQIDQHEDSRYKVQKGRDVHKVKSVVNSEYKRKRLGVIDKKSEEELTSEHYHIHGIVDEVLFLDDGTAAPLDYKFAEYKGKIFKTYKIQSVLYGLLIKDNYNINVHKGYLVYTRSKNHIEEIHFTDRDFDKALHIVENIVYIIDRNFFPGATRSKKRCNDCCYRNICVK